MTELGKVPMISCDINLSAMYIEAIYPNISLQKMRKIWEFVKVGTINTAIIIALAKNTSCPEDILSEIGSICCEHLDVFIGIARNENAPKDMLERLESHRHPLVKAALAGNKNTLNNVLIVLARDQNMIVRGAVAANKFADRLVINKLINDEKESIRSLAAKHPSLYGMSCLF